MKTPKMRLAAAIATYALALGPLRASAGTPLPPPLDHPENVVDVTLKASLDPKTSVITGTGTYVLLNTSARPLSEIWLHLYLNAFKNTGSRFLREPIGSFRGGAAVNDWGYVDVDELVVRELGENDLWKLADKTRPGDIDETDARVPLLRPIAPGERITIDIRFHSKLPSVVLRTGHCGDMFFAGQWFPKLAKLEKDGSFAHFPFYRLSEFYSDFGRYAVTLDVPAGYRVGATGRRVSQRTENGRTIEERIQEDVHDFAWVAWKGAETKRERIGSVDVEVLYPPGYESAATRELETIRFALPHYGERYGAYPYATLTMVHPPELAHEVGGMEYPTLITTGGPWFEPRQVRGIELVTIHEFGHQYFYGLLASNESLYPFLDEGVNSYAEQEAMRAWLGPSSIGEAFGLRVSDTHLHAIGARRGQHNEPVGQTAASFTLGADYSSLVYSRTATLLETLSRVFGAEAFRTAMRKYALAYRFRHPTPDDFLAVIEAELGARAADAARRTLFEKGWIDFAIAAVTTGRSVAPSGLFDRDGSRETVASGAADGPKQKGFVHVMRRGSISLPVSVELRFADGSRKVLTWDGVDQQTRLAFESDTALVSAVVDPDRKVLLDANFSNNHRAVNGTRRAPRTFERALHYVQALLAMVRP